MRIIGFIVGFVVLPAWAMAQTVTLQQAQQALFSKQYALAKTYATAIEPQYPIDSAVIYARATLELGEFDQTRVALNIAQSRAPQVAQVRVLRAMLHLRQNQPRRAMLHLRRALDLAQSTAERQGIIQLLRKVQGSLKLRFNGGFGLAPSTNIANVTDETELLLSNGKVSVHTPSRSLDSGIGLRLWGGATYTIPFGTGGSTEFFAQFASSHYDDAQFDNKTATAGVLWKIPLQTQGRHISFKLSHTNHYAPGLSDVAASADNSFFSNAAELVFVTPLASVPVTNSLQTTLGHTSADLANGEDYFTDSLGLKFFVSPSNTLSYRVGVTFQDRNSAF
ncbi:MAG: hypothetical protein AAF701_00740, partial [Pseudomonadota bacterium]